MTKLLRMLACLLLALPVAAQTTTPKIGLQIPATNAPNWQVQLNYNWNRLDTLIGNLAPVANSGSYSDLSNTPAFGTAAFHPASDFQPVYAANGVALPTGSISGGTCVAATGSPFTATGVTTAMVASFGWASDPTGVNGYGAVGGLAVRVWPAANAVSVSVCNPNVGAITAGAISINARVRQ